MLKTVAKPTLPDNYQEKTWEKLQKAVIAIQTSKSIEYSLEELYQAVENMCSHKMDSQLYTKLTSLTETHVKSNIKTFFADTMDKLVGSLVQPVECHRDSQRSPLPATNRFTSRRWMNAGNRIANK